MSSGIEHLVKNLPLFAGQSPTEVQRLLKDAKSAGVRHRESLFNMGDSAQFFGVVLQGAFKLVRLGPDGSDTIVHFATPGDVVAGLVMATPSTYPVSAVAMGSSVALKIPRQTFLDTWSVNPSIQQSMREILFTRMSHMHEQKALQKAPLGQKIAREIVTLIERCTESGETFLPIPITRQEIADAVGASVESVIRVMSEWSQKGYMTTTDHVIHISRMDKVLEIMMGQIEK